MKQFIGSLSAPARIIIGIVLLWLLGGARKMYYPEGLVAELALGAAIIVYVVLCVMVKPPLSAKDQHRADAIQQHMEGEIARSKQLHAEELGKQAEGEARAARQAEWNRTHGTITTRIAGVTFKNEDGTSRQDCLKDAYVNDGEGELTLETYDYKGEPAIQVIYEGLCIGNIPRDCVESVSRVLDKITASHLDVEPFEPSDEEAVKPELLYRADLTIVYTK